jgi:TatD DNase family protein
LQLLEAALQNGLQSPHPPVAVGEIGLDFFVTRDTAERQLWFFVEQLRIAQRLELPVILHVRAAVDAVLKCLRNNPVRGGIAHAYNGSLQQAEQFMALGFKLGFGGAMSYPRALKIRALAQQLPMQALVLETDAPDIAPAWLGHRGLNRPDQLPKIAEVLAELRGVETAEIAYLTGLNARSALPGIAHLFT